MPLCLQPRRDRALRMCVARTDMRDESAAERRVLVRQIAVPQAARALSTLSHVDYGDAFLIDVTDASSRTAGEWARAIFDDAPRALRLRLWSGWTMLGLRLAGPGSREHILGWKIRRMTDDFMLLGADSLIGMPAELLVKRQGQDLLFDTFVQKTNPIARAAWTAIQPTHEQTLPSVLKQFTRRVRDREQRA